MLKFWNLVELTQSMVEWGRVNILSVSYSIEFIFVVLVACELPLDVVDYGVLVGDCLAY